jgi:CRP/FNR family cyclic AMP-dependent transcriptional regulator
VTYDELFDQVPHLKKIFSGMPADIKSKCTVKKFQAGNTLVKKKDSVKYVYVLIEGELKVVNEFENGSIYAFASLLPLSFIGELEVLSEEQEYAVTIETITECSTIQIKAEDFVKWLECDHLALLTVTRGLAKKMYPTSSENGNILFLSCINKVEYYISKYCNQRIKDKEVLKLERNRQQIADEIGSSVKSVNRSIKRLKEEGLVTVKKGKVYISKSQYLRLLDDIDGWK